MNRSAFLALFGNNRTRRRIPRKDRDTEFREYVIGGLVDLRKAGILYAVWCDSDRLSVAKNRYDLRHAITWEQAGELVDMFKSDKS